jgi:parallel beta-helix repeat protein
MKNKIVYLVICTLLISGVIPVVGMNFQNTSFATSNSGKTLYVGGIGPGNYTTIQEAVDAAIEGDTVLVYSGTYDENVIIDKSIKLLGYNKKDTIIDSHGSDAISITANNVKIQGFTVKNAATGIVIYSSIDNEISYNIIKENDHYGIYVESSSSITISGNTISYNSLGGLYFLNLFECNIRRNKIRHNENYGIYLKGGSNKNIFFKNVIEYNMDGIRLSSQCDENEFYENTFRVNSGKGVYIFDICSNNIFYHNDFLSNTENAFDPSLNIWDYNNEGNYWTDYAGVDNNPRDGIGDQVYDISGGDSKDRYPLMNRYNARSFQIPFSFLKILIRFIGIII